MKRFGSIYPFILFLFLGILVSACDLSVDSYKRSVEIKNKYVGEIVFENGVAATRESDIFNLALPDPELFLFSESDRVIKTLYYRNDSLVPSVKTIRLLLKDFGEGSDIIASKHNDYESTSRTIEYNTRWVAYSFEKKDTAYLKAETKGVLCHELTHVFQLRPKGIGNYYSNKVYWAYVEGMADAVRCLNGYFTESDRKKGGNYADGYRYTGFFFAWLTLNKDADFLRKINRSSLHVVPWSFDGAIKYALGDQYNIDMLWLEYLSDKGDITPEMAKKLENNIRYAQ